MGMKRRHSRSDIPDSFSCFVLFFVKFSYTKKDRPFRQSLFLITLKSLLQLLFTSLQ